MVGWLGGWVTGWLGSTVPKNRFSRDFLFVRLSGGVFNQVIIFQEVSVSSNSRHFKSSLHFSRSFLFIPLAGSDLKQIIVFSGGSPFIPLAVKVLIKSSISKGFSLYSPIRGRFKRIIIPQGVSPLFP